MKNKILLFVCVLNVMFLMACGSETNLQTETSETTNKIDEIQDETSEQDSSIVELSQVEVGDVEESGYRYYYIYVKNLSDEPVNTVSISVSYLDEKGNIVDSSYPQMPVRVLPGQIIAVDGLVEEGTAHSMTVDSYSCYTESEEYYQDYFSYDQTVSLTEKNSVEFEGITMCERNPISGDICISNATSDLVVKELQYLGEDYGFKNFSVVVENNTDKVINTVTINMILLDENGNIIECSYPQGPNSVKPGQSITIDGLTSNKNAKYFTVDGFSYYFENDEYVDGFFSTIPQAISIE